MSPAPSLAHVHAVRRFNRFYTVRLGLLSEELLDTGFSLTESRVLYELARQRAAVVASDLVRTLTVDAGYLSRILRRFMRDGLLKRTRHADDRRQLTLALTPKGRRTFETLAARTDRAIEAMLSPLSLRDRTQLMAAMTTISTVLAGERNASETQEPAFILRDPRPGDLGWVVARHGAVYAEEYGWDRSFEALVAGLVARFVTRFDPRYERCWIAERHGDPVGCVFVVRASSTVAKLRMLLVEPSARGLGLGGRLADECIAFARRAGYRRLVLWTNSVLADARRLYESRGFHRVSTEPIQAFGHALVSETWALSLSGTRGRGLNKGRESRRTA